MNKCIKIHELDNVAVASEEIRRGEIIEVSGNFITALQDIKKGHKIALANINKNEKVIKYANPIGIATADIKQGEWVHVHNISTKLGEITEYKYEPKEAVHTADVTNISNVASTFLGYQRKDGKVGVRNEIWIIPTVGCVNQVAMLLAKQANDIKTDNIDKVIAFTHPYGCSQLGIDQENTRVILSDLVHHPNAAAVLVLGLGCENSNINVLKKYIGQIDEQRVKYLNCQDAEDEIGEGMSILHQLIAYADSFKREQICVSKLVIGLKCGGSDGFSGITANPVVGRFSDILVSNGGSAILTEVPEMFGAEKLLMNRCKDREIFNKTVDMINNFKEYFLKNDQPIYENPSPGNKEGGISTLEDKSLGCTQKSGSSLVSDVLMYGERLKNQGLNLLYAPGNDLVASTALAAAGAQIILFTTGRGTPFASVVPTVKISSNSELASKKKDWIDFDASLCLREASIDSEDEKNFKESGIETCGKCLYEVVLEVANGKKVKSEKAGYHDMTIFKQGVTL